jgi:hypothetical protein
MARNPNIDDDTRARAKRFVEDADMPKPAVTGRAAPKQRVVSKKELEESGLSLRDFLNRERGLTRRGEQPSVGGKVTPGEYKSRAQASDSDSSALDRNYVRRDMGSRMEEIDRETQGDFLTAMKQKPRRPSDTQGANAGDYMAESAKSRRVRNMYERGAEETGMKRGGKVSSASKRADGIAQRGKTRA